MDIGSNISKKIQAAIKSKLIELNAYVDDELPDYIMIMIANKKPEEQMYEALSLFLSDQASDFTKWLYELLKSLKEGDNKEKIVKDSLKPKQPVKDDSMKLPENLESKKSSRWDVKNKQKSIDEPTTSKKIEKVSRKSTSNEAVIEILNETDDFFDQEILECESVSTKPKKNLKNTENVVRKTQENEKVRKVSTSDEASTTKKSKKHSRKRKVENENVTESVPFGYKLTQRKSNFKEETKSTLEEPKTKHKKKLKRRKQDIEKSEKKEIEPIIISDKEKEQPLPKESSHKIQRKRKQSESDNHQPVVHRKLSSTITLPKPYKESIYISDDSASETELPSKSVVSKVAKIRQNSRLPPNKQASKFLLMKAVSEAEKSVRKSRLFHRNPTQSSQPQESKHEVERSRVKLKENVSKRSTKNVALGAIRTHLNMERTVEKIPKTKSESKEFETIAENSDQDKKEPEIYQCDSRRIICKDQEMKNNTEKDRRKLVRNLPNQINKVQFDSRKLQTTIDSKNIGNLNPGIVVNTPEKKKLKLRERSVSPCFVVTLDGEVSSSKNKNFDKNGIENKKKTFVPVKIEAPQSNSSHQTFQPEKLISNSTVENVAEELESADTELSQMREKLIKMQEEARKLKSIQEAQLVVLQKKSAAISAINEQKTETKSIHVANVHFSATEKQLSEHFSVCGKVLRTTIIKDAFTGISKGFAYLEFEEANSIDMALALDSTPFCTRIIKVSKKDDQSATTKPITYRPRAFYPSYPMISYRSRFMSRKPKYPAPTRVFAKNKTWVKSGYVKM